MSIVGNVLDRLTIVSAIGRRIGFMIFMAGHVNLEEIKPERGKHGGLMPTAGSRTFMSEHEVRKAVAEFQSRLPIAR